MNGSHTLRIWRVLSFEELLNYGGESPKQVNEDGKFLEHILK